MKHTKKAKPVKEIQTKDVYSGENSPYWEYLDRRANVSGDRSQEGGAMEFYEPPEANPDKLSETDVLWNNQKCEDERLDVVKQNWDKLTSKQQEVLHMIGYEGRTMENCAVKLSLSKSAVQSILNDIRKKLKKAIQD